MTSQSRFSDNIVTGDYRRVSDGIVMSSEHKHPYYELSVVLSGRLEIRGSSDFIKTDAPCVIFHFPGSYHSICASPDVLYERYNLCFTAGVLTGNQPLLEAAERLFCTNVSVMKIDRETLVELLYYIRPYMSPEQSESRRTALLGVILDILKDCRGDGDLPRSRPGSAYVSGVLRYISGRLTEDLSAGEIASQFGVSRAKLAADFKRETGMTLAEYVELSRIDRARMLLTAGASVQSAALGVGYRSAGTFIRAFRKLTGTTPGAFAAQGDK